MRRQSRWTALVISLFVLTTVSSAAAETAAIEGRYRFVGGSSQQQALQRAIESVVTKMNVMIRGIARSRMSSRIFAAPQVQFERRQRGLQLVHEPLPPRLLRFDGQPLRLSNRTGESLQVRYRQSQGRIIETISHGRNARTNVYQFNDDGLRMALAATIRSPYFPTPVQFRLSYRRLE